MLCVSVALWLSEAVAARSASEFRLISSVVELCCSAALAICSVMPEICSIEPLILLSESLASSASSTVF